MYQGESVGVSVLAGIQQPLKCPHPLLPPLMCPLITYPQGNYPTEAEEGRKGKGLGESAKQSLFIFICVAFQGLLFSVSIGGIPLLLGA